ncbi:methyltransferase domain-containing protein [Jannaschia ovalis]|uniref:Methyltransferase domain-containing protein n=1 Tax=Jannaschia ovalis TaxID=3038773 RepID=A0ABY8L7H2_9RHOB|nr:methyltransferase domain-containing protein [Jannaschia sp. GRR-S6-38]WGH77209.1 methyltransferase domain-containing protein [Jannaschia sp. GRR-S6-38]
MSREPLTDRHALALHRARADGTAWFLHEAAMDELEERLKDVNRSFTKPAIVTGQQELWSGFRPGARVVADTDTLALEPEAHDLVIHAMALHWADDPVGQLIQCRRALQPDGLMMVATLGGETLTELRAALAEAEAQVTGGLSPRVGPMGEVRDLGALLQRAGLALPVADVTTQAVRYRDLPHLARDLRAMGESNALAQRHRSTPPRDLFSVANQIYKDAFPDGDGIRATFQTVYLTGWAPSEDQPKPLRPGSAQARLADALGVKELGSEDR